MSVVRNTGYNLVATIVPIVVSLITVPAYVHAIGEERYGVLALIAALLGYFGVFDLGLSTAAAQRIALVPAGDVEARRRTFWTALATNLAMGLVGAAVILPVALWYAGHGMKVPDVLRPEIREAMVWLVIALPVMLLVGVMHGAMQGAEEFAALNFINVVTGTLGQLLPLAVALWISPRLPVILPTLYATRVVTLLWYLLAIKRRLLFSWGMIFDRNEAKALLSFGGWVTVSSLIGPLMVVLDRMVIGVLLGARAVSHYTVPFQLAERALFVPGALLKALFPRIAGAETDEAARTLSIRGLRATAVIMTAPMVAGTIFIHPFLTLWIDRGFADAASLTGMILIWGFWWNAMGLCCLVRLQASGRPRLIAVAHIIELLPYFALLAAGMKWLGAPGAALAFSIRVIVDDFILAHFAGLTREVSRLSLIGAALVAPAIWLGNGMELVLGWRLFAGLALVAVCTMLSLLWLNQERASLRAAFRIPILRQ